MLIEIKWVLCRLTSRWLRTNRSPPWAVHYPNINYYTGPGAVSLKCLVSSLAGISWRPLSRPVRRQASLVLSYEGIPRAYVDYLVSSPRTLAYHVITGTAVAWHAPAVQGMQVHLPVLLFLLCQSVQTFSHYPRCLHFLMAPSKRKDGQSSWRVGWNLLTSYIAALPPCWVGLPSAHPRPFPELPFTPHTATIAQVVYHAKSLHQKAGRKPCFFSWSIHKCSCSDNQVPS